MELPGPPAPDPATAAKPLRRRRLWRWTLIIVAGSVPFWLVVAYLVMPSAWIFYTHRHPALADLPGITHTAGGIPGDPVNVALIGSKKEVMKIMIDAQWYPADALSLKSCLEIAEASVLKRPYDHAPVSSLYLFGRKEDLAFEQPVGSDPRQRHHVRFWLSDEVDWDGRPVWVGSAIYDRKVGLNRDTGQITHVTAPDIDAERDKLFDDLRRTGKLSDEFLVEDFHKVREGKNGGGDPWHTDGNLDAGVIKPTGSK